MDNARPHGDERDTQVKWLWTQPVDRRDVTRGERGAAHGEVACELVEAHREATPLGAGEVDLHDDRGRPRESLADAKQDVGGEDPIPRRRPHEEEWNGHGDQPPRDKNDLAAEAVGEAPRGVVGQRLGHAEHDNEGQDGRARSKVKLLLGNSGENRALQPHHGADKTVDDHEERELREVCADAEPRRRAHAAWPRLSRTTSSISAGVARASPTSCSTNASTPSCRSGFQRRS